MAVIFGECLLSSANQFLTSVKVDELRSEPYKRCRDYLNDMKKKIERILREPKKNKAAKTLAVKSKYSYRFRGSGKPHLS